MKIPVLGEIACGDPILADENIEEYINKLVTIQTSIHTNFCTAIPRQKAKLQYGIK